jgi:hypothetical protein
LWVWSALTELDPFAVIGFEVADGLVPSCTFTFVKVNVSPV